MNLYVKIAIFGVIGLILAGPLGALAAWVVLLLITIMKNN